MGRKTHNFCGSKSRIKVLKVVLYSPTLLTRFIIGLVLKKVFNIKIM